MEFYGHSTKLEPFIVIIMYCSVTVFFVYSVLHKVEQDYFVLMFLRFSFNCDLWPHISSKSHNNIIGNKCKEFIENYGLTYILPKHSSI